TAARRGRRRDAGSAGRSRRHGQRHRDLRDRRGGGRRRLTAPKASGERVTPMPRMKLLGEPGWGSAIVDAQLAWYGFDYDFEAVGDLFASAEAREKVGALNPLAQIPTLVLPSGEVMTESAAITLYLADLAGDGTLVPAPG